MKAAEKPKPKPKPRAVKPKVAAPQQDDDEVWIIEKSAGNSKVKQEENSDVEMESGGYVLTEDEGKEAEAAKNSPVKNGVRLTSQVSYILPAMTTQSPF